MYKCTECGSEYEIKPEYCDCGNNEFVLTIEEKQKDETIQEHVTEPVISEKTYEKSTVYNNESVRESENKHAISSSDIISIVVFIACLILSILILFFWNPVNVGETEITEPKVNETVNTKIPSIDSLWKESIRQEKPVAAKTASIKAEPKIEKKEIIKQKVTNNTQKVAQKPKSTPKTVSVPVAKSGSTKTLTNNTTANIQKQAEAEAAKRAEEAQKKAKEAKLKAENEAKLAAENAKKAALQKQELLNYKIALRNAIAQRIDFTRVLGDGDCVVSFKIDSSGKLINRTFAKQSTNLTLNEAVYKAVMSTPSYNPPPSGYKNETLSLNIKFYNGNFAITLN